MDSDSEVPASQHTVLKAKPADEPRRRKKRKNLSLENGRRRSTVHRTKSDEPSTSHSVGKCMRRMPFFPV